MLIKMYYPTYFKKISLVPIVPLVPALLATQFYLRGKIDNYDPDVYEPWN
jgi:hypothetical protein